MTQNIIVASFADEADMLRAVQAVRDGGWEVADVYTPYAIHDLERLLGWRRSRLPVACFVGGAIGAALALWFQFWTTARILPFNIEGGPYVIAENATIGSWNWPLNVGGRPWNSLPAFVPATFECMVLLAGFGLVFAWLWRCRLFPGKNADLPAAGITDNRFIVAVRDPGPADRARAVRQLLHDCRAVALDEGNQEEPQ